MYRIQNGLPLQGPQVQPTPNAVPGAVQQMNPYMTPSPAFQQVQRAQQVAQPMAVMPAQAMTPATNMGAVFMQSIAGKQTDPSIFGQ